MTSSNPSGADLRALARETLRSGTLAGLAMIPFAALFRAVGLRINEYGRKTLELVVGDVAPPLHYALSFVQHLLISWFVAVPVLWFLGRVGDRRTRVLIGALYGAAFYVVVNAWALPLYFGDPLPWALGVETVYPSLAIHLVYGVVLGLTLRAPGRIGRVSRVGLAP
jgi:hypothetical protein